MIPHREQPPAARPGAVEGPSRRSVQEVITRDAAFRVAAVAKILDAAAKRRIILDAELVVSLHRLAGRAAILTAWAAEMAEAS